MNFYDENLIALNFTNCPDYSSKKFGKDEKLVDRFHYIDKEEDVARKL